MIPLWVIRYVLPGVGAVLVVAGAMWWHAGKVDATVEAATLAERQTWQAARVELLALRTQRKEWAAKRLAKTSAAAPQAGIKEIVRVETHWRDRPVRDCFDADVVQSLEEARAAVRRAATASPSND